jgi:branched-chain amino acid transport system substrate-binding protein
MRKVDIGIERMRVAAAGLAMVVVVASPAIAQDAFRFGLAMPLTGSQALYGQDQVKAAEWAVAEINKGGGINGKKVEMIVLDTQADPQLGIQMANRLVSVEKVPTFVTAWSAVVKAVAPIANDNQVVELSVGANSPDIAKLGDYVYTTFPLADVDIAAVARYAVANMGKKKAAIVYINNETGIVAAEVYKKVFTASGGTIVANETYDPKATDFTGPLLKVRAASPDIIHLQGLVSDTPQVIAQMRQLGLTQPITSYSVAFNPKLIEQLGAAAEGVIATSLAPGVDDSDKVKTYVARWVKDVGREPNGLPYTHYLYDAPYLVAAVFKSLDDKKIAITGDNFRKEMLAMRTFDLPLTGKTALSEDHLVIKPVYLMEVRGGKWTRKAIVGE